MPGTGMGPSWPQELHFGVEAEGPKVQGGWTWGRSATPSQAHRMANAAATRLCAATRQQGQLLWEGERTGGTRGGSGRGGRGGGREWEVRGWGGQEGRHSNGRAVLLSGRPAPGEGDKTFSIDFCLKVIGDKLFQWRLEARLLGAVQGRGTAWTLGWGGDQGSRAGWAGSHLLGPGLPSRLTKPPHLGGLTPSPAVWEGELGPCE